MRHSRRHVDIESPIVFQTSLFIAFQSLPVRRAMTLIHTQKVILKSNIVEWQRKPKRIVQYQTESTFFSSEADVFGLEEPFLHNHNRIAFLRRTNKNHLDRVKHVQNRFLTFNLNRNIIILFFFVFCFTQLRAASSLQKKKIKVFSSFTVV
jgi:hypothetical protein